MYFRFLCLFCFNEREEAAEFSLFVLESWDGRGLVEPNGTKNLRIAKPEDVGDRRGAPE